MEGQSLDASSVNPQEITVEELDELVRDLFRQRATIEGMQAKVTDENKKLAELEAKAVKYLKALNRKEYKCPAGTISVNPKWRFNLPQGEENWAAFKEHLKREGLFDQMLSINSNTYNAYVNSRRQEAEEKGEFHWEIPGVPEGKLFEALSVRKGKGE
jgi:hypothetical protein